MINILCIIVAVLSILLLWLFITVYSLRKMLQKVDNKICKLHYGMDRAMYNLWKAEILDYDEESKWDSIRTHKEGTQDKVNALIKHLGLTYNKKTVTTTGGNFTTNIQ